MVSAPQNSSLWLVSWLMVLGPGIVWVSYFPGPLSQAVLPGLPDVCNTWAIVLCMAGGMGLTVQPQKSIPCER